MLGRRAFLASLAAAALAASLSSCARAPDEPAIYTGSTIGREQLNLLVHGASLGKPLYAVVNRAWLPAAYPAFRAWLSEGQYGITRWDDRAQCTLFCTAFEVFAQKRYFAQAFHGTVPAPGIAVGTMWYPVGPDLGHALNVVVTERGRELWEPQTGQFAQMPEETYRRAFLRKFD